MRNTRSDLYVLTGRGCKNLECDPMCPLCLQVPFAGAPLGREYLIKTEVTAPNTRAHSSLNFDFGSEVH